MSTHDPGKPSAFQGLADTVSWVKATLRQIANQEKQIKDVEEKLQLTKLIHAIASAA